MESTQPTWKDAADFAQDFAESWGMTSETRTDLQERVAIFVADQLPRRDTLGCRRCDHHLKRGQHDIFLVRHLHEAHGLTVQTAAAEMRAIREEFDAGHAPAARIAALEAENAKLRAALERADDMANALVAYFNKRGVNHSMRKGNEDIGALADALSNYGPLRLAEMETRRKAQREEDAD